MTHLAGVIVLSASIRRASALCSAVALACVLAASVSVAGADAAPTMVVEPSISRGPLGNDAHLSLTARFRGTEYGGFPSPLTKLAFHLPLAFSTSGLPTCPASALEPSGPGPKGCPNGSAAGPPGSGRVFVAFGKEVVPENVTTELFYGDGGALTLFVFGHEPVLVEILARGRLQPDTPPYATALQFEVPLVETVPGGQLTSTDAITLELATTGAPRPAHGLFELPGGCATPTLPFSGQAGFFDNLTASATSSSTCLAGVPPAPVLGRSEGATVTSGVVLVRKPGSSTFVPLHGAAGIPDGSELDTTAGAVAVSAAPRLGGQPRTAEAHGGVFLIHQSPNTGNTGLTLTAPLNGCARRAAVAAKRKRTRHLWVSDHGGRWSTKGRYVSTSVEGTSWLTADTCSSSTVTVRSGRVAVHDLLRHRTTILTAHHSVTVRGGRLRTPLR